MLSYYLNKILFFYLVLICSISISLANENDEFYEGWQWAANLKATFPHGQEIDYFEVHKSLSKVIKKDLKSFLEGRGRRDRNVALFRLSLITKEGETYKSKLTKCFDRVFSISGESEEGRKVDFIKATEEGLHRIEPMNFTLTMPFMQSNLDKRFSNGQKTQISPQVYAKYFVPDVEVKTPEDLTKLTEQRDYLHNIHTHSEQKILFFLDESIKSVPFYYNFAMIKFLEECIDKVENFVLRNRHLLNEQYMQNNLDSFKKQVLGSTTKETSKRITKLIEEEQKPSEEKDTLLKSLKEEAESKLEELKNILDKMDVLRQSNPQVEDKKEGKKEEKKTKKDSNENVLPTVEQGRRLLGIFSEMLQKKKYLDIKALEQDKEKINKIRLEVSAKPKVSNIDWIADLKREFIALHGKEVVGMVLHIHSLNDICENCSPSIAAELEREGGFVERLNSLVASTLPQSVSPIFKITVSCDQIRETTKSRYSTPVFNHTNKPHQEPCFYQVLMKEAKAKRELEKLHQLNNYQRPFCLLERSYSEVIESGVKISNIDLLQKKEE